MTPHFLPIEVVLQLHDRQLERFGGATGIRDQSLLESALGQAQSTWAYTECLHQTAAQYWVSLARNHPFIDGNKRTAAHCMLLFLRANGFACTFTQEQLFQFAIQVATGALNRDSVADLLKNCTNPIQD